MKAIYNCLCGHGAAANMDFKITGVTANGSSITLPTNSAITVNNADHIRTGINGGPSFTIPQSSGSTTLEVTIETTLDGVTKTATVEYIVNTGAFVNQTLIVNVGNTPKSHKHKTPLFYLCVCHLYSLNPHYNTFQNIKIHSD